MNLSIEKQNDLIDLYLLRPSDLAQKDLLPHGPEEMKAFLEMASFNKISSYLFLQIKKAHLPAPESLLKPLEESYQKIKMKNGRRLEVGLPILDELKNLGVEIIILKGNAIAEEIFLDIGYKPMNDIDILVKKEDLTLIYEIFLKHHLLTAAPLEDDFRKQEKYSHHWPPFFDRKLDLFFGTHWNIAAPTRKLVIPLQEFWTEKEEFQLMGKTYFRLCPKHFILHLCVHLNSAKTGLREIGDVVKFIEFRQKDLDPLLFIEMVRKAHAEKEVYEAFSMVHVLKSFSFVDLVLKKLDQVIDDEQFKRMVKKRVSPRHKIVNIRTNYISKIEKTFALFMLTEDPLEKTFLLMKMWRLYLLVPGDQALRLDYEFPDAPWLKKGMASLLAPLKISRVFIKDMGLGIFLIVTLRHQWVLLSSYFSFIEKKWKGEPVHNLKSIAQGMGLDLVEMKEIQALD